MKMTFEEWWNSDKRRYYFDWEERDEWVEDVAEAAWNAAIDAKVSIDHILSQVEEETIERCELYVTSRYDENGLYPSVIDMPRKYKEQDDA